ncbi:hypothetical protein [Acidobacterium sp. S8]|uniref:hypothetical protein n=1 Tax=Acidobacterium sp. S8 TaxID=1641854 RepID=UPI00131AD1B3|nr:hypothetical protein [Acidobacterium sp. S8]
MRRSLAISLLLLFSFSLLTPFFAPDAEAAVPACCRRGGRHHCVESDGDAKDNGTRMIAQRCPYAPEAPAIVHLTAFTPAPNEAVFAGLVSHPSVHAQIAAQYRISFDRSRQKRGPPVFFFL